MNRHIFCLLKAFKTTGSRTRLNIVRAINLKDIGSAIVNRFDKLNIKLYYLPPYSPNLPPIERLWKVMNEHIRDNQYFATTKEFRDNIDEFFNQTLPEIGDTLGSRINDDFQVLIPAP